MKYFFWINIWFLGGFASYAQNQKIVKDSIKRIELQEVTVLGDLYVLEPKKAIQQFHYVQNFENAIQSAVSQFNQSSHLYLNVQGPNLLTTVAIRGQSAQAIPVVWKNWTLNSSMNGTFDLSLMNTYLLNKSSLVFSETQQSAGWGGAGAILQLSNSTDFSGKEISYQYGSFGKQQLGATLGFKKQARLLGLDEWRNETKVVYHKADNNFLLNLPNNDTIKQVNNELIEWGFINTSQLKFTNLQQLDVDVWWQKTKREIPPALNLPNTESHQLDSALRVNLHWLHSNNKLKVGVAYFNELNQFIDPFYDIKGIHKVQSFKSFAEWNEVISPNIYSYSTVSYQLSRASSTNLSKAHHFRNSLHLKSHLIYQLDKIPLSFKVDAVLELTEGKIRPFRPGIYFNYHPNKKFELKGQLSKHYRIPTFNDLYWQPGGNPNLLPEQGWLSELHTFYQIKNWCINLNLFYNIINEEIIWLPDSSRIWKPKNVAKVRNRGFDVNVAYQYQLNTKAKVQVNTAYTFVEAVKIENNISNQKPNDIDLFKQLIYKPKHKAVVNAKFFYQNFTFNWAYRLVGKRYTTTDHSNFMPAYQLSDFTFSYLVPVDKLDLQLSATVYNLFNTPYEVIEKRPMPGRHFLLTSNFKF